MGCNCNEKKYNISMGCCVPVLAPIENYYTKTEVDELIESAITSGSCCITPEEVDEKIASAKTEIEGEIPTVPTSNTAFTNDAGYITGVDLSNYATLDDVASGDKIVHNEVQEVDGKVQTISGDVRTISGNVQGISSEIGALYQEVQGVYGDLTAHTANTSIHLTSGNVQTQINNSISGKADYSDIKTYSAGNGIKISNANAISLGVPVYKGIGDESLAINLTTGNGGNNPSGSCSIAANSETETRNPSEAAFGHYNVSHSDNASGQWGWTSGETLFSVGNGCSQEHQGRPITKHNAFEIMQNGDIYIADTNETEHQFPFQKPMVKLQDTVSAIGNLKFVSLTQADYDALVTGGTTDANTIYFIKNS